MPPDPKNDKQLIAAVDLLHGVKRAEAAPAKPAEPAPVATPTSDSSNPTPAPAKPDATAPN